MKLKIANAVLLLLCFFLLSVLSGVIPVMTQADASSAEVTTDEPPLEGSPEPASEPEASPTAPPVTDTPAPTEAPEEAVEPEPRLVAATITGDSPLDNDTYYDISAEDVLSAGGDLALPAEGYQVLILHTHTTEAYTPEGLGQYEETDAYRTTDPDFSVVRVGTELADALSAYGLQVLHDTELHDYPSYTGSYERSGTAIEEYLTAYPSIRLIIDLHRDALGDEDVLYKTLADIDGVEAAQLMFVMGSDVNLDNPNWRENLRLALTIQAAVDARYPTLMRPTVLCDYRYNQQLSPGCLLLEVGTSGNTLTEALTAVRLFAEAAGPLMASWVAD